MQRWMKSKMNNIDVAYVANEQFPMQIDEKISLVLVDPQYASEFIELMQVERDYLSQWLVWPKFTFHVSDNLQFVNQSLDQLQTGISINCYILHNGQIRGGAGLVSINQVLSMPSVNGICFRTPQIAIN
jgi:hypothetical protein